MSHHTPDGTEGSVLIAVVLLACGNGFTTFARIVGAAYFIFRKG